METNPYRAPQSISDAPPIRDAESPSENTISETELTAFAGGKHYPRVMSGLLNGTSRHAGFNIWAAIFGIQWFFFRKLYLFGLFSAALETIVPLVCIWTLRSSFVLDNRDFILIISAALFLITRIIIGYMANIALCLKAAKIIQEVDILNKDNEAHLRLIAHAGGISVPSLLGIYVVLGFFRAITLN